MFSHISIFQYLLKSRFIKKKNTFYETCSAKKKKSYLLPLEGSSLQRMKVIFFFFKLRIGSFWNNGTLFFFVVWTISWIWLSVWINNCVINVWYYSLCHLLTWTNIFFSQLFWKWKVKVLSSISMELLAGVLEAQHRVGLVARYGDFLFQFLNSAKKRCECVGVCVRERKRER